MMAHCLSASCYLLLTKLAICGLFCQMRHLPGPEGPGIGLAKQLGQNGPDRLLEDTDDSLLLRSLRKGQGASLRSPPSASLLAVVLCTILPSL